MTVQRSIDPRLIGYNTRLNWYSIPPPYEITLEEFELFALDRLHILKAIENAQIRNIKSAELSNHLKEVIKKYIPLTANTIRETNIDNYKKLLFEERRKDHISHFLLRLAYCKTEDLRNWFLKMETELFRMRLLEDSIEQRRVFREQVDLGLKTVDWKSIKEEEKTKLVDALAKMHMITVQASGIQLSYAQATQEVQAQTFYQVEFEKVLDMVSRRQVVVKGGYAYVPGNSEISLLVNEFKDRLKQALEETAKALPRMDEDERLNPILNSISKQYITSRSAYDGKAKDVILHSDVPAIADPHMPLCMRSLYGHLKTEAHLKHFGRLQFGLFLKGIGLPLEEAIVFWRKAFHKMTDDKFQKEYLYNIRHSYGQEGKRTDYTPFNCGKIITTNHPGAGERHGCPFRHFNEENLRGLLRQTLANSNRASGADNAVNEIMTIVKNGHYQVACTRLYEMTHQNEKETVDTIAHPNQWFEMSYYGAQKRRAKKERVDVETSGDVQEVKKVDEDAMMEDFPDEAFMDDVEAPEVAA